MRRVAIVHDYLTQRGGAERVVLALLDAFPGARVVTSTYAPDSTFPEFADHQVETILPSWLPLVRRDPRAAFPLLPHVFRRHRIHDADLVICSSSGWSHAVTAFVPKLVYCHTPARWLYALDDYLIGQSLPVRAIARATQRSLIRWDIGASATATAYVANSSVVRERIRHAYHRDAEILHPPASLIPDGPSEPVAVPATEFLLTVARRRGYKNSEVVERAAAAARIPLVIVGEAATETPTTHAVGHITDPQLRWLYANCKALVAASYEDFGLTPVEAMSFGKPVVALRAGGYLDTVVDSLTGLFFDDLTVESITCALQRLDSTSFDAPAITDYAERFSLGYFRNRIRSLVDAILGA